MIRDLSPGTETDMLIHTIPPVYDENSRILILGSFPSVMSRESAFFYGHPRNRFWPVLSALLGRRLPQTNTEKRDMLLERHIALWDVIKCCEIEGSSDASIKNAQPNDLSEILSSADIRAVFTNGSTADRLYRQYQQKQTGMSAVRLPSTSPANAAWTPERLTKSWAAILEYLK